MSCPMNGDRCYQFSCANNCNGDCKPSGNADIGKALLDLCEQITADGATECTVSFEIGDKKIKAKIKFTMEDIGDAQS